MSRPKVKPSLKRLLIEEAGGKCANPGCPRTLTELHHIREWHVCFAHDKDHMIAICPACHDSVSRGSLRVDDDTAYAWKAITRARAAPGHLYVEPSDDPPRLLLGTISVQGTDGLVVFSDEASQRLAFRINDMEIMNLEASVKSLRDGSTLARVHDGYFDAPRGSPCVVNQRAGHFRMSHPVSSDVLPEWALAQMREFEPTFGSTGEITLVEMEVLAPNVVRVEGAWLRRDHGVVITAGGLSFVRRGLQRPVSLVGEGLDSVLHYTGPVDKALFGFSH